jgi:zinc protease
MRARPIATLLLITALIASHKAVADVATEYKAAKSAGGIAFLYRFDDETPFAAINFGWRDFYAAASKGKAGLPAITGPLVLQGADNAGHNEFVERLKDLGASATLSGGTFQFNGNVRAPANKIGEAMALVATALKSAEPSDKIFRRVIQKASGDEEQTAIRAETIAIRSAMRLVLGDHPVVRAFDPRRFERISQNDFAAWRKVAFDKTRLRVVASGRLSESDAGRAIDAAFGDLPERTEAPMISLPPIASKPKTVVIEQETTQSAIVLIGAMNVQNGPDAQMAAAANGVLGGGSEGRLWQAVRGRLGASYGASSNFQLIDLDQRLITLGATVANDQVGASLEAMRRIYATWHASGITPAELTSNTARLINNVADAFREPTNANGLALGVLLKERPIDDLHGYAEFMRGLTATQMNEFIKARFPHPDQLIAVILAPTATGIAVDCIVRALSEISECGP